MKKYYIKTFGCSMNQADSEKINMVLLQSGFVKIPDWEKADLIIFNTCSIRQKAEDRVFWMAEEVYKKNKIIVWITWCMVRKTGMNKKYFEKEKKRTVAKKIEFLENKRSILNNDDKLFPRLWEKLDFTLRIEETKMLPLILTQIYNEKIWQDDKFDDYLKQIQLRENPSSANIIIQTGCDNYCSFCVVPYTRWKEFSRSIWEILEECESAVKSWAKEINLIWQNVNSYWKQFVEKKLWNEKKSRWQSEYLNSSYLTSNLFGKLKTSDYKYPFRRLLEEINKIPWLDRIRFTSSNPHDMTRDVLDSHFDLKNTCNYLHFALQSWNNQILKKMNRKHNYEDFRDMVFYLRKKDPFFSISTDIIVWFSWETDDMFEDTVRAFKECEFDFSYNARYSVRKWTLAEKMYPDNVSDKLKSERWHVINNLLLEIIKKRNEMVLWKKEDVLISWEKDWYFFGRTRNFKEVFIVGNELKNISTKIWDIVKVKITDLDKWVLRGEVI